jgi:hypothetical protein
MFMSKLEALGLEGMYTKALDGTQSVFLLFRGGDIEKLESSEEWSAFYTAITRDNIDFGREVLKLDPAALVKGNFKPPFMIYLGKPTTFTATRDWYQHFNIVLAKIDFREDEEISQIALQEILNHQNGQVLAIVDNVSQLDKFYPSMSQLRKTIVVSTVLGNKKIFDECLTKNYRYFQHETAFWDTLNTVI